MSIPLHISPRIIPSIASLYNDVNRIFMEYIDNAIDSAEEFCNKSTNSYSKPIEITLVIQGDNYRNGKVTIYDNCFGITNFPIRRLIPPERIVRLADMLYGLLSENNYNTVFRRI